MKVDYWESNNFEQMWKRGEELIVGLSPLCTFGALEYYNNYFKNYGLVRNSSFIVTENSEIVALVPIFIFDKNGENIFSFGKEGGLKGPFLSNVHPNLRERIFKCYKEELSQLATELAVREGTFATDPIQTMSSSLLVHPLQGYDFSKNNILTSSILDIRKGENFVWKGGRKSYKSLINKARKSYLVEIIDQENYSEDSCLEYKRLHILAAGRQTRSDESFDSMFKMVSNGSAFLVLVSNQKNSLGGYLFFSSCAASFYASSATCPSVTNNMGIGHLGVWSGIEYSIKKELSFVDMALVRSNEQGNDDKVAAINFFKRGFGTVDVPVHIIERSNFLIGTSDD
jgi:hypothetical protein